MNIIEAIKLANKEGSKIRRSFWTDYHWIEIYVEEIKKLKI